MIIHRYPNEPIWHFANKVIFSRDCYRLPYQHQFLSGYLYLASIQITLHSTPRIARAHIHVWDNNFVPIELFDKYIHSHAKLFQNHSDAKSTGGVVSFSLNIPT